MNPLKWLLFATIAVASVGIGFIAFEPPKSGQLFSRLGYWNLLLCVSWFVFLVLRVYGREMRAWFADRRNWTLLAIIMVATLFLYTREGGGFKITFDEQSISNVAKNLHLDRVAEIRASSLPGIEDSSMVDKRPILYHFLVATVHDLSGFRIANAFVLNGVLTAALLLLLFIAASKIYDQRAGWFTLGLACCSPLICQNASGGGSEITNLVGIATCFLFALRFVEKPEDSGRLSCLVIAAALFSHARYESPILVIPVGLVIAIEWMRTKRFELSWTCVFVPLFFIPIAWQHKYVNSNDALKQYVYDSDGLFSLDYMFNNLGHATNFLFTHSKFTANSPIISVIGIASAIALGALSATRFKDWKAHFQELHVAQVFGAAICAQLLLILGFTYGQLDDPVVTRLGMPFLMLIILCGGLSLSLIQSKLPQARIPIRLFLAACFIYVIPLYSNHLYTSNNMILKRIDRVMDFHQRLPQGNYLYISNLSQDLQIRGVGNMDYKRAILRPSAVALHMRLKTFDDIFVIQFFSVELKDNKIEETLLPGNDLGPWFELETIDEFSYLPFNFTRLSRIKRVTADRGDIEDPEALKQKLLSETHQGIQDIDQRAFKVWEESLP